jgi:hypothetical protein
MCAARSVISNWVGFTRVPDRPTLVARGGTIGPQVLVPATFARVVAPPRPLMADSARVLTLRLHPRAVSIEYRQASPYRVFKRKESGSYRLAAGSALAAAPSARTCTSVEFE